MRSRSYIDFKEQMLRSARGKGFPLRVMIELTYRCNFECRHCYVPFSFRKKSELNTRDIFLIIDQLAEIGCFYLGFTGGEPFMREDIMDILRYSRKKGFEAIVYTNGSLINKDMAGALSDLGLNKIDITIPAISKIAFEKISGEINSRDKVFRTIELLYKKGVPLGFKTCVLKDNQDEIGGIQDFALSLGVFHRLDSMLFPRIDGSTEPLKYRGVMKNDRETRHSSKPTKRSGSAGVGLENGCIERSREIQKGFSCGVGISQAAITPLGELKMCLMIDYPKYKIIRDSAKESKSQGLMLKDAWERLKKMVASVDAALPRKCNYCKFGDSCKWCPARGWLVDKDFAACDTDSLHFARLRRKAYERRD